MRYRHRRRAYVAASDALTTATEALLTQDYKRINHLDRGAGSALLLAKAMKEQLYQGRLRPKYLRMLRSVFTSVDVNQQECQHMRVLFLTRLGLVLVGGILANVLITHILPTLSQSWWIFGGSFLLILLAISGCEVMLAKHWFWYKDKITPAGWGWFNALFGNVGFSSRSFDTGLQAICMREIRQGVNLSTEKLHYLRSWQEQQEGKTRAEHRHKQDYMPLLELVVLGGLATLQLSPFLVYLLKSLV